MSTWLKKYWKSLLAGTMLVFGLSITVADELKLKWNKELIKKHPKETFAKVIEIKYAKPRGSYVTYNYQIKNKNYTSEYYIQNRNVNVGDSIIIRYSDESPTISEIIEEQ